MDQWVDRGHALPTKGGLGGAVGPRGGRREVGVAIRFCRRPKGLPVAAGGGVTVGIRILSKRRSARAAAVDAPAAAHAERG